MPENISKRTARKSKYNAKTYDQLKIYVPKGRKAIISAYAKEKGVSLTAYIMGLINGDMGDWKPSENATIETDCRE